MKILFFIHCICLILLSFISNSNVSCSQFNTNYTLCLSNGTDLLSISEQFNKVELNKKCQKNFVKKLLSRPNDQHPRHNRKAPFSIKEKRPIRFEQYLYGFIATVIISALSLVGVLALPMLYRVSFKYVLGLFTAIATGTLLGDAMFHLVPFVLGLHNHTSNENHHHHHRHHHHHHDHAAFSVQSYQWKILLATFTLYVFYLLEVFLHWFAHYKHDHNSSQSHNHSNTNNEHSHYARVDTDVDIEHSHLHHNHTHHNLHQHLNSPSLYSNAKSFFNSNTPPHTPCVHLNEPNLTINPLLECTLQEKISDDQCEQVSLSQKIYTSQFSNEIDSMHPIIQQLKTIKSTGWMVLFGDSVHNFADGLAIGAAFSEDIWTGITTTIAVACHELPHELGDYAVLLQSGFSHSRALLWNFLSGTTAIVGFLIGAIMSNNEHARQWIIAATIGMFLYIALVDLLPTLLADGKVTLKRFLVVNIGFLFGISIMFLLAIFENQIIRSSTH